MEKNEIFNTLSYKIFYSVAQEYIEKYEEELDEEEVSSSDATSDTEATADAPKPIAPVAATAVSTPYVSASDNVDSENEKTNNTTRNIIIALIVLIIGGAIAWLAFSSGGSKNNPLGVQKPKWEKFVMVNAEGVMLFKEANTTSPNLKHAVERLDGCMPGEAILWSGEKAPRGYDVDDYDVEMNSVYPVIDESEDWYKVYIGTGEIREAYLQKQYSEEVKPEPITKEIIDKVKTDSWITHRLVEKGEFANLYLERGFDEMGDGEFVLAGVLTEGCIVIPDQCYFHPDKSDVADSEMKNTSNDANYQWWQFTCSDKYWKSSDVDSDGIFDVNLLEESDIRKIVMAIRPIGDTDTEVWYYFPTVASDKFVVFRYSFSPTAADVPEGQSSVSEYRVDGETLIATIAGEDRELKLELGNTALYGYKDLDGDGSMEAVVSHFSSGVNGEPVDCPYVVYYDAETDQLKKTDEMALTCEPTFEGDGDKIVMVQREGLRMVSYSYEAGKLNTEKDEFKSFGNVLSTIEMSNVFGDAEYGEKSVSLNFDNEGDDEETLTFSREEGGYYHGLKMTLQNVSFASGDKFIDITASKFQILEETTNEMPNIIGDNYLYRWDGGRYEKFGWDGTNLVTTL